MPTRRMSSVPGLAELLAERTTVTLALVDLVEDAAFDVLRAVPPATDKVAAGRLLTLLESLRRSARTGRSLARRLRGPRPVG